MRLVELRVVQAMQSIAILYSPLPWVQRVDRLLPAPLTGQPQGEASAGVAVTAIPHRISTAVTTATAMRLTRDILTPIKVGKKVDNVLLLSIRILLHRNSPCNILNREYLC